MNTIYDNTFVLGQTSATNFIAGQGIKIDSPSEGTVRIRNDETVLWTTANSIMIDNSTKMQITLSEPASNFQTMRIVCSNSYDQGESFSAPRRYWDVEIPNETTLYRFGIDIKSPNGLENLYEDMCHCQYENQGFSAFSGKRSNMTYSANTQTANMTNRGPRIFEIRGINRISGSNA